jgi:hypothetical protein
MNLDEYKIFYELVEVFKKAANIGVLKHIRIDQRELKLRGTTRGYEWILDVKKVKAKK